jgi:hypothetical protein
MAKFYQSKLTEFKGDVDVLEHVYPHLMTRDGGKYFPTMDERLGDAECINCPKETEEYVSCIFVKTITIWEQQIFQIK